MEKPINVIVVVITVIEAFRAYDIIFAFKANLEGREVLSTPRPQQPDR